MSALLQLAKECGADFDDACSDGSRQIVHLSDEQLSVLALRVRANALEEAAKLCDTAAKAVRQHALEPRNGQHAQIAIAMAQIPEECATGIRALAQRGEKT